MPSSPPHTLLTHGRYVFCLSYTNERGLNGMQTLGANFLQPKWHSLVGTGTSLQDSVKGWFPGCVKAAGKARQEW